MIGLWKSLRGDEGRERRLRETLRGKGGERNAETEGKYH